MQWNIARAKQQFSEVVRLAAQEPQVVYNRQRAVAALVDADTFQEFVAWRAARQAPGTSWADRFGVGRQLLAEANEDGLHIPERADRANAWLDEAQANSPCN